MQARELSPCSESERYCTSRVAAAAGAQPKFQGLGSSRMRTVRDRVSELNDCSLTCYFDIVGSHCGESDNLGIIASTIASAVQPCTTRCKKIGQCTRNTYKPEHRVALSPRKNARGCTEVVASTSDGPAQCTVQLE
jgi:hypothetical protein